MPFTMLKINFYNRINVNRVYHFFFHCILQHIFLCLLLLRTQRILMELEFSCFFFASFRLLLSFETKTIASGSCLLRMQWKFSSSSFRPC